MNKKLKKISGILLAIAIACVTAAAVCFVLKAMTIAYVDPTTGILHEKFFLLPMGYGFTIIAVILSIISIILSKKK